MRRKETENNEKVQHRPVQKTTPQLKPSKPFGEVKAKNPRMPDQEVQKSEKEAPIVASQTLYPRRRCQPVPRSDPFMRHLDRDSKTAHRREICFTLKDDIFVRFNAYRTAAALRRDLIHRVPIKIDIGAIYRKPVSTNSVNSDPEEREYVLDIDISDYDDVRTVATRVIRSHWKRICRQQDFWSGADSKKVAEVIKGLDDVSAQDQLIDTAISTPGDTFAKWLAVESVYEDMLKRNTMKPPTSHLMEKMMMAVAYPRLDVNVSLGLGHLLKAPFCIHPKTGKICVPFNPKDVWEIDPNNTSHVPTVHCILKELDASVEYQERKSDVGDQEVWSLTSLKPAVQLMIDATVKKSALETEDSLSTAAASS
ncbi:unnamed protein product [Cyprideis torosa]|uniref:DNA primase n=1 Tax=Cyprideis torosa TaxID=163714 RepID=A0A7R8ZND8_9CRUS|nr:unnamed protein product [Cyprideis torosa]CAG0887620.1 unnamed protein product [Cyprideis torosa]